MKYNSMPLSLVGIAEFRMECKSFFEKKYPQMKALKFLTGHVDFKLRYFEIN